MTLCPSRLKDPGNTQRTPTLEHPRAAPLKRTAQWPACCESASYWVSPPYWNKAPRPSRCQRDTGLLACPVPVPRARGSSSGQGPEGLCVSGSLPNTHLSVPYVSCLGWAELCRAKGGVTNTTSAQPWGSAWSRAKPDPRAHGARYVGAHSLVPGPATTLAQHPAQPHTASSTQDALPGSVRATASESRTPLPTAPTAILRPGCGPLLSLGLHLHKGALPAVPITHLAVMSSSSQWVRTCSMPP